MDENQIIWLVVLCVVVIFLILVYLALKNRKSTTNSKRDDDRWEDDWDDDDDEIEKKSSQKTDSFYNELAFTFPLIANIDEPLEVSKYLFDHKNVTEKELMDEFSDVHNFKNENGHISFEMDGSHFECNSASKEIIIDNTVHVNANREGLFFSTEDKSMSVAIHEEDGEYVVDNYNISNPEGISTVEEDIKKEDNEEIVGEKEFETTTVDEEIVESDTSY